MLFWTRATVCIGTITVLAIGHLPASPPLTGPALSGSAAALAGEACRSRPALCESLVRDGLVGLAPRPPLPATAKPDPQRPAARRPAPVALGRRSLT